MGISRSVLVRVCEWETGVGEQSNEHVFMKLRKCFAEVRPVKNRLHFWSLDLALDLAQIWW